jgi:hypothetical protein
MTLETILKAAVSSMIRGHHAPHCFSAWVQGKGYVNQGEPPYDRADYLQQLERTANSEIENMGYAPSYADKRTDQPRKGVVWANWNCLPRELGDLLERMGFAVEWSDSVSTCDGCHRCVETEPSHAFWEPGFIIHRSAYLCLECAADEGLLGNDESEES